jgi:transcriptional regulator with XRE-family HTH domain
MKPRKLWKLKGSIYLAGCEVTEFAGEIGMDRKTLSAILNGHQNASEDKQKKITKALNARGVKKSKKYFFGE